MKITIAAGIFWPDIGGPATYIKNLADELRAQNIAVDIVCRSQVRNFEEDKYLGYEVVRVKNNPIKLISYISYFIKLWKTAKDSEVIYAQGAISSGYPAILVNKFLKKKIVVKIVGDYAWETAQNRGETHLSIDEFQKSKKEGKIKKLHDLQTRVCKEANLVIVPSQYLKEMVRGWGVPEENIQVIYNGAKFKSANIDKEEARKEIGISGNLILSIGRLVPWKGFKMLIKIMPEIIKRDQFARLVIIGEGPDRKLLEMMIKNLGLEKKVYLVGAKSKDELAVYLAAADMFVLNTGYEGFSHQILEAMLAQVPIITTNVGGNKEIMRHGENGLVVEYNDEDSLLSSIKMILERPEAVRKMLHGAKKAATQFNHEKMITETINSLI